MTTGENLEGVGFVDGKTTRRAGESGSDGHGVVPLATVGKGQPGIVRFVLGL